MEVFWARSGKRRWERLFLLFFLGGGKGLGSRSRERSGTEMKRAACHDKKSWNATLDISEGSVSM